MQSRLLALALVLSASSVASADMIPSCPPGQHAQMNPVAPGAMHHAGGSCVDDPPTAPEAQPSEVAAPGDAAPAQGGGCSVGGRSSGPAWMALAVLAGVLVAVRSRRPGFR